METLRLRKEMDKTQDRINKVQSEMHNYGFTRNRQYRLNRLLHKLNELNQIEWSNKKYIRKKDEEAIQKRFWS